MRYLGLIVAMFFASTAAAASFDPPKRKSGLWELKISSAQVKADHAIQQCIDEKTDDLMKKEMGENQKTQCSKNEMHKEGDRSSPNPCANSKTARRKPAQFSPATSTPPTKPT